MWPALPAAITVAARFCSVFLDTRVSDKGQALNHPAPAAACAKQLAALAARLPENLGALVLACLRGGGSWRQPVALMPSGEGQAAFRACRHRLAAIAGCVHANGGLGWCRRLLRRSAPAMSAVLPCRKAAAVVPILPAEARLIRAYSASKAGQWHRCAARDPCVQ